MDQSEEAVDWMEEQKRVIQAEGYKTDPMNNKNGEKTLSWRDAKRDSMFVISFLSSTTRTGISSKGNE